MAHPFIADARGDALDKLHRLTRNYGAASRDNIPAPPNRLKLGGPEGAVGYGADVDVPRIRADRIARRPMQANPPQFKKGGPVKKRAAGGGVMTPGMTKRARGGTLGQALGAVGEGGGGGRKGRGGRGGGGGKPHTKVNVIVAPQPGGGGGAQNTPLPPVHPAMMGGPGGMPPGLPPPPMAGGGGGPPPGMPPAGGLPPAAMAALLGGGAGPGGLPPSAIPRPPGPGAMPPPGLPIRKKGGRVHDDEAEDKALIQKTLKAEGLKRAKGGRFQINKHYGGGSGMGRLEKIGETAFSRKGHSA